jgi:hypothetical protein
MEKSLNARQYGRAFLQDLTYLIFRKKHEAKIHVSILKLKKIEA